ncbi:MAG: S-layer homology domain-containing protein [Phormidesmis sp.]
MFSDVENHWASECIVALAKRGLISGYPTGTFRPGATVTRAEFAALMPKIFSQLPIRQATVRFKDVLPQYWASAAIEWVTQRGLFSGYEDDTFRPRQTITRAQAITVIVAGLEATQGVDAILLEDNQGAKDLDLLAQAFSDGQEIPVYAKAAVSAALDRRVLDKTDEPRSLLPNRAMTRGEVAALLCRILTIPTAELIRDYPALTAAKDQSAVLQRLYQQEAGFSASKLAFLDKSIQASPYRNHISNYALRLKTPADLPTALNEKAMGKVASYPPQGELFFVNEGGLDFLSADVLSACVCLSTVKQGQLQARWLGRDALSDRQLWSATKFIPLLNVVARANAIAPNADIDRCRIRATGSMGNFSGYPFHDMAAGIMTYDNRIASSNSLAVMFKNFETPERLENWTRQLTGNKELSFQGRYGEVPFIQRPELWHTQTRRVLLKAANEPHNGQNLVSTYDLTRLISMVGWHWQLPSNARIPGIQSNSLESVIRAMGLDMARYVDVALETLGLTPYVREPVIISKSGFGRSDQRDRTELVYCALVQFSLPRQIMSKRSPEPTLSHQRHSLCFTLLAAQNVGDADQEAKYVDALMAASVTEIIRRAVIGTL